MNGQEVILTNVETGKQTVFETLKEAAQFLGCGSSQIVLAEKRNGICHGYSVRYGRVRIRGSKKTQTNICFDCKKACGGCSWSEINPETRKPRFEPVPGWTAEKAILRTGTDMHGIQKIETYAISACPLFEEDEPRKVDYRQLSELQNAEFTKNIDRILRKWANE
jgi:hypothetical protein